MGINVLDTRETRAVHLHHICTGVDPTVLSAFLLARQMGLHTVDIMCTQTPNEEDQKELQDIAAQYDYIFKGTSGVVTKDAVSYTSLLFSAPDAPEKDTLSVAVTIEELKGFFQETLAVHSTKEQEFCTLPIRALRLSRKDRRNPHNKLCEKTFSKIPPRRL